MDAGRRSSNGFSLSVKSRSSSRTWSTASRWSGRTCAEAFVRGVSAPGPSTSSPSRAAWRTVGSRCESRPASAGVAAPPPPNHPRGARAPTAGAPSTNRGVRGWPRSPCRTTSAGAPPRAPPSRCGGGERGTPGSGQEGADEAEDAASGLSLSGSGGRSTSTCSPA